MGKGSVLYRENKGKSRDKVRSVMGTRSFRASDPCKDCGFYCE